MSIGSYLSRLMYSGKHNLKPNKNSLGSSRVRVGEIRRSGLYQSKSYRAQPRIPFQRRASGRAKVPWGGKFPDWT